jgi:xylan 1,4-beta-xylosidase
VERYGAAEVARWYWEVWNEPNIGYWSGTRDEFFRLHDYAVDGVRKALRSARVGGPDVAGDGGDFTKAFLDHALHGTNFATGATGTPLDFVSFHAKGKPAVVDGHVRMGVAAQLATIDAGFRLIAAVPELKHIPIVIGESDPDGCAACQGPQLAYRNSTVYASYTLEALSRTLALAERRGVALEGTLTWAFEFEGAPLFAGFRALATRDLDLPVLNTFRLLSKMAPQTVDVSNDGGLPLETVVAEGVRGAPDIGVLATRDARRATILLWHYHDDDLPGPVADVFLQVDGLPRDARRVECTRFSIDATHSNAFTAWQRMGSPQSLTPDQHAALAAAGTLAGVALPQPPDAHDGHAALRLALPRHAISMIELSW